MYTLKFETNTLKLVANTGQILMEQPFRPGTATEDKRNWTGANDAISYWHSELHKGFRFISNTDITIEE
jgi:hypothetical protein